MSTGPAYTVHRSLAALELVSFASANAAQVAAALQVHPRTARRILRQLETSEWVQSRPASGTSARTWEPTLRLVALAGQLVRRHPLAVAADATLAAVRRDTSPEHAAVVTPAYRDTVTIAGANGGAGGLFGALAPAHASAGGKALLAGRERGRASVLAAPLAACTDRTVTDPAALVAELAAVKTRGWAEEDGEHRDGQVAVAAPVRVGGETIAAVTVRASASGYANRAADELVAEAQAYARDLESRLDPSGGCDARGAP